MVHGPNALLVKLWAPVGTLTKTYDLEVGPKRIMCLGPPYGNGLCGVEETFGRAAFLQPRPQP